MSALRESAVVEFFGVEGQGEFGVSMSEQARKVNVCGVPFEMSIVDGGVLFSEKSGFYGVSARFMFEYNELWYLTGVEATFPRHALCHLVKMHKLLEQHIGDDHGVTKVEFKSGASIG